MSNDSYKNEISNASWIIACRVVQFLLNLLVSLLTARYLGPDNYGVTYYASSVSAFFTPIALMGLNDTFVRELADYPDREGELLGTSLSVNALSSIFSMVGYILFIFLLNHDDRTTVIYCAIYSIFLLFLNCDITGKWFQAKLLSRHTSVISLVAFVISAAYRVFLLANGKNIYWFAVTPIIDYAIISVFMLIIYRKMGPKLSFSRSLVPVLLSRSRYYILTSILTASFTTVDKILIKKIAGAGPNGLYSAAFSIATATSFVCAAVIDSFRPSLVSMAKTDSESFTQRAKTLFSVVIWITIIQNTVFTLFGGTVVGIMLGEQYAEAVPVFRLLAWETTFSYLGSAKNVWILANDKHKYLWKINTIGALSGLIFNYVLIKMFGIKGAALAAVLTQFTTNFLVNYIFPEIRPVNRLILQSVDPRYLFGFLGNLFREIRSKE
ncbi:MAG: flippase [Oscillospiraceae bacterium]|nr:flippase [Oscillospiraceae bacterium]